MRFFEGMRPKVACARSMVVMFIAFLSLLISVVPNRLQAESVMDGFQASTGQAMPTSRQVMDLLQASPELMEKTRNLVAHKLAISSSEADNQIILAQLEKDDELRVQVTSELIQAGYSFPSSEQVLRSEDSKRQSMDERSARLAGSLPAIKEERESTQKEIPHRNIPSLNSLYQQVVLAEGPVRRFGLDYFERKAGNSQELLPSDIPVGPNYLLGVGDSVNLSLWGSVSNKLSLTVDRNGQIAIPEVAPVRIAGLSIDAAQRMISKSLATQYKDEHVDISLGKIHTIRVYVVGDVQHPGAYDISALSTALNALYAAGGPTAKGSLRTVRLSRGPKLIRDIDLYELLLKGVRADDERLQSGDTLLVTPVGAQVTVLGKVKRPAIYELKQSQSVAELLEMAGGTDVDADVSNVRIERVIAHQRHTMLDVVLSSAGRSGSGDIPSFMVQDGDKVIVAPISLVRENQVFLTGHVIQPGPYAWHKGMTAAELIPSYQKILAEPSDRVELVRLVPPDMHPKVQLFDLPSILSGAVTISLLPYDVLRIHGRYEEDAPMVTITGEVMRPGKYPMPIGMTVSDLISAAGGLRRSADQENAELSSYDTRADKGVSTTHQVVSLKKQETDSLAEQTKLKPGDVLSIHKMTHWDEIGTAVVVEGEVGHPGTYGIQDGERLSSVLIRAGGMLPGAYPKAASLQREKVREAAEKSREELIRRLEREVQESFKQTDLKGDSDQQNTRQAQYRQLITNLQNHPASGRLIIHIEKNISAWKDSEADIRMVNGDRLIIPKITDTVNVMGQVYNPTGITFVPGKNVGWYLQKAGGVTKSGDLKAIFVMRADGSVDGQSKGAFSRKVLEKHLDPGDTILIPERFVGSTLSWKNLSTAAQVMSSVAIFGAAAGAF